MYTHRQAASPIHTYIHSGVNSLNRGVGGRGNSYTKKHSYRIAVVKSQSNTNLHEFGRQAPPLRGGYGDRGLRAELGPRGGILAHEPVVGAYGLGP